MCIVTLQSGAKVLCVSQTYSPWSHFQEEQLELGFLGTHFENLWTNSLWEKWLVRGLEGEIVMKGS